MAVVSESASGQVELSVVVPVFNEEESLPHLHAALIPELEALGKSWEVIYVDDGSSDGSFEVLRGLGLGDPRVRVIRFRRNFGQTAAMAAGFGNAQGDVIVPMDADLQNDPKDIGRLLDKLAEGYDVVSGWRAQRQDAFWSVTLPSRIGNAVIGRMTGVVLHDYGCTLTAYRREVLNEVRLYGEMHRFIPAWAAAVGANITELPVAHHARRWGQSKYNLRKAVRVLLDLMTVRFLLTYATKPQYFFGRLGLRVWGVAGLCWTWTVIKRLIWGQALYTDPFFMAGIFLALAGLQILMFGLLSEMSMRTYYESQGKTIYVVRETVNLPGADQPDRRRPGR
jgi:glycosyltransferase involved in cell wall biosynthesis